MSNGRNNTQVSYGGGPSIGKSPNKSNNIYGQNQTVISASGGQGPSGPQQIAGPSGQARGGSGMNVMNKGSNHTSNAHQASTSKAQKKKTLNLSSHQNNTSSGTSKLLHQSQISLNNINGLGGNSSHHNTFYGNINQQNHPSR